MSKPGLWPGKEIRGKERSQHFSSQYFDLITERLITLLAKAGSIVRKLEKIKNSIWSCYA